MKLLFDQNISHRLISHIKDIYPEARQVREIGLENSSDKQIWEYAKENDFSIVTFDGNPRPKDPRNANCPRKAIYPRRRHSQSIRRRHLPLSSLFLTSLPFHQKQPFPFPLGHCCVNSTNEKFNCAFEHSVFSFYS